MLYRPICGKGFFGKNRIAQVRVSWLDAGGFGHVPLDARVHPRCDELEQAVAAAAINTVQLMCGAFGAGLAGVVVNLRESADATAARWMFGVFAILAAVGVMASYRAGRGQVRPGS